MPHPSGKKAEGRARLLASAGRGFRRAGFGGIGVDGLARDAGVTSGAFYAHFKSKAEAFTAAVAAGMADLREGLVGFRRGPDWRQRFIDFYLEERRTCDAGEACALQSLTGDVARAGAEARAAYEGELLRIADLAGDGDRARGLALLALLSGGTAMARAAADPAVSADIAAAVRAAAAAI